MDYLAWSDRIASYFFRPEMAGRRVHLYVTGELIEEVGNAHSADMRDFIAAVKTGPPWVTRQGLCQKALQSMQNWRERGREYPPYIGYLTLFVLAASIERDFASHAYYPRLRTLLGEDPIPGQYPSFDKMWELWFDLECWSNQDKSGTLGIFYVHFAFNKWNHIGLPVAQILLTKSERDVLPAVFAKAALDPITPPSDQELAVLLIKYGQHALRPRTLRLLKGTGDGDEGVREILIEVLLEELRNWDGTADTIAASSDRRPRVYGLLSLCCQLDTTAGCAHMTFRCRTNHDFPEDGLLLSLDGYPDRLYCEESVMGWSSPISTTLSKCQFIG